jgi:hypothetical protein
VVEAPQLDGLRRRVLNPRTTTPGGEPGPLELSAPTAPLARVFAVLLVAWLALSAATHLKTDVATRDFERLDNPWMSAFYLALLAAMVLAYARLEESEHGAPAHRIWLGFAVLAVPAALAFPVGSKDIFFYAFYGKMWGAYAANPHVHAPSEFSADPWFRFLHVWTNEQPTPYGPLFSLQMRLVYALCGDSLAAAVAVQKAINAILAATAACLLAALQGDAPAEPPTERARRLALWLWSPLLLFESVACGHNDLAMTVLLLSAALLWIRARPAASVAALTLAFWYKWYALVLVPLWLTRSLRRWGRPWLRTSALVAAALSLLVLLPFLDSLGPMLQRLATFHGMREIFPDELPPPLWLLFRGLQWLDLDGPPGRIWFDAVRTVAFVGGVAWLTWRAPGSPGDESRLFLRDVFWSLLLFFSFVPTMLWPWHLVPLSAFALGIGGRPYERGAVALTAAGLLSYFLTFAYAVAACALIAGALWFLRRQPHASRARA